LPRVAVADDLAADRAALSNARLEEISAHSEASQYSGGLLLSLALAREATAKLTEVQIEQKLVLAALGIPIPDMSQARHNEESVGRSTSDEDALK